MGGIGKGDHLYLIDGSAYIFRAYHALPPLTRKSDGLPIGAVSGFCNMLHKMVSGFGTKGPTHLAVIFDYSSKSFRNEIYDDYKVAARVSLYLIVIVWRRFSSPPLRIFTHKSRSLRGTIRTRGRRFSISSGA